MKKTVCLIGRPNVGKSTLFNRLIKEKKAIIMDEPGITRDRLYGNVFYNNKAFLLIDTGGITFEEGNFNEDIKLQAELAINESDVIIYLVDGRTPITSDDIEIRNLLMRFNKKVVVAVNKLDNDNLANEVYNFYELGFANVFAISAAHNLGIKELLDEVTADFSEVEEVKSSYPRISLIGRPNVGKSSLVNAMLNEERSIVSDVAGTTRDSIDTNFRYEGNTYTLVDTAGMRKKGKIYENVEKYSLIRSLKAIENSDVCVLVIDASEGIIEHDKHIASYAIDAGKGLVLCVNKWDLIENSDEKIKEWKLLLKHEFQFIPYVKVVFLSAKTKKRVHTLMPEVLTAYENNNKVIKTSLLNDCIVDAVSLHEPPSYKGRRLKILFVNQTSSNPPKFTFSVNSKNLVHFSYQRYLENKIRESFDLTGTPIIIQFKNRSDK
ncbi:MAG: ribosome biogenesis GTPase Der [Bacilli bacterium]|nr:ribosome biogenesis GTPase Der [Bacilli bacterium]